MSHQWTLGIGHIDNRWQGRHVHWGAPDWLIAGMDTLLADHTNPSPGPGTFADLVSAVWDDLIDEYARFDRFPDRAAPRTGWGRVTDTRPDARHEGICLYGPAPNGTVTITAARNTLCDPHNQNLEQFTGTSIDAAVFSDEHWECAFGVKNHVVTGADLADGEQPFVTHPHHRVDGCDCYCTGMHTSRFEATTQINVPTRRHHHDLAAFCVTHENIRRPESAAAAVLDAHGWEGVAVAANLPATVPRDGLADLLADVAAIL